MLKDETGNHISNPMEINNAILDHYKSLFSSANLAHPTEILPNESINSQSGILKRTGMMGIMPFFTTTFGMR